MNRFLKAAVREVATHPYRTAAIATGAAVVAFKAGAPTPVKVVFGGAAALLVGHAGLHYTGRMTAAEMLRWNPAPDENHGWSDGFRGAAPHDQLPGGTHALRDYQHGYQHGAKAAFFEGVRPRH